MKIILNEKEIVDKALNDGYYDEKKPTNTIKLLIKYFYGIGQDKIQVRSSIEDFMKKNFKGFNEVKWQKILDNMVKDLQKENHELFIVDDVKISSNELNIIQSINNLRLKKLAFVLLVYAKIYNQMNRNDSNWVNSDLKDIYSDTKMAVSSIEQGKMIYKLGELGLVEVSRRVDCTNIKVLFIDENDETININDFRELIFYYQKYIGEKIGNCEKCNKLIKITTSNNKYCKECQKKKQKEWDKEYQKEKRRVAINPQDMHE